MHLGKTRWLGQHVPYSGRAWRCCVGLLLALWAFLGSAFPGAAQSRQPRIGVLTPGLAFNESFEGFREGLAQLGYVDGQQVSIVIMDAKGDTQRLTELAAQLVTSSPDLILTIGTSSTTAVKQATATLPIVFAFVADPLRAGLVASHASSQNNLTGVSNHAIALSHKRLEFLQEVLPGVKRVLTLVATHEQPSVLSFEAMAALAPKLGIELVRRDVSTPEEVEQVLNTLLPGTVEAICHIPSALVGAHMDFLSHKARDAKIPLVAHDSSAVERGALLSYGADFRLLGKQAAKLAVKILHGAKPADLPIQTPEHLPLSVNLTTARALGLKIPRSILENADLLVE